MPAPAAPRSISDVIDPRAADYPEDTREWRYFLQLLWIGDNGGDDALDNVIGGFQKLSAGDRRAVIEAIAANLQGEAIVTLPDNFVALNQDFRYQLTVVGRFAQAIVLQEVKGHHFKIKTDKPKP